MTYTTTEWEADNSLNDPLTLENEAFQIGLEDQVVMSRVHYTHKDQQGL
jgi:hypothetical protein